MGLAYAGFTDLFGCRSGWIQAERSIVLRVWFSGGSERSGREVNVQFNFQAHSAQRNRRNLATAAGSAPLGDQTYLWCGVFGLVPRKKWVGPTRF